MAFLLNPTQSTHPLWEFHGIGPWRFHNSFAHHFSANWSPTSQPYDRSQPSNDPFTNWVCQLLLGVPAFRLAWGRFLLLVSQFSAGLGRGHHLSKPCGIPKDYKTVHLLGWIFQGSLLHFLYVKITFIYHYAIAHQKVLFDPLVHHGKGSRIIKTVSDSRIPPISCMKCIQHINPIPSPFHSQISQFGTSNFSLSSLAPASVASFGEKGVICKNVFHKQKWIMFGCH